jgi:hypothetical protein
MTADQAWYISTGHLPGSPEVQDLVTEAYETYRHEDHGEVSRVYPALAAMPPGLFGVCVADVGGRLYGAGDADREFTIMSVAKPFTFALICDVLGAERARQLLGTNATGLPFDSLEAVERTVDGRTNPMVNAGASYRATPPGNSGGLLPRGCLASPAATCTSTRRRTKAPPPPITATGRSPGCWRAAAPSRVTRRGPSSCTPASPASPSQPPTWPSWAPPWPTAASTRTRGRG